MLYRCIAVYFALLSLPLLNILNILHKTTVSLEIIQITNLGDKEVHHT